MKKVENLDYKELMVIKEKDEHIKFLIREKKGIIKELLMIVKSTNESVIISIRGNLTMNDLQKVGKTFKLDGMDMLDGVGK